MSYLNLTDNILSWKINNISYTSQFTNKNIILY